MMYDVAGLTLTDELSYKCLNDPPYDPNVCAFRILPDSAYNATCTPINGCGKAFAACFNIISSGTKKDPA